MFELASISKKNTVTITAVGREIGKRRLKSQKLFDIQVPEYFPEDVGVSPFTFSPRLPREAKIPPLSLPERKVDWRKLQEFSDLAQSLAAKSAGGPTFGENYLEIEIDSSHPGAGSHTDFLLMCFGRHKAIRLAGLPGKDFPRGYWLSWDFSQGASDLLESIPTDAWDEIFLENPSRDGILVRRVQIVHSGQKILDWRCQQWLDASRSDADRGRLGFAAMIREAKLRQLEALVAGKKPSISCAPQLYAGALELGKTDGRKYDSTGLWCTEFASWCLRKALWDTPPGEVDSRDLENRFKEWGRLYTLQDVLDKKYTPAAGDYLQLMNRRHSALFVCYEDGDPVTGPENPTGETKFRAVEGCAGGTVRINRGWHLRGITTVGSTR